MPTAAALTQTLDDAGAAGPVLRVRFMRGGVRWRTCPECLDELFDSGGLRLREWFASGRAQVIKTGAHRTVYRVDLPGGSYYVKHYRCPDWKTIAQNLLRPCRAELELSAAQHVADAGIATFQSVAIGRREMLGVVTDSFLVTREIGNSQPLDEYLTRSLTELTSGEQAELRHEITQLLGEMAARLHRHRLLHRDLHAGNILIRPEPGSVRLWLIDLHSLLPMRRFTPRIAEKNLSQLNIFLSSHGATRTDRLRFFRVYWRALADRVDGSRFAERVRRLEAFCHRVLLGGMASADSKWRSGNRRLIIADTRDRACRGVSELGRGTLLRFRDDPESLFAPERVVRWITRGEERRSAAIRLEVGGRNVHARVTARIIADGRDSGWARNAWEGAHTMLRRLVTAPRALMFVSRRIAPGSVDYLVTQELPETRPLVDVFKNSPRNHRTALTISLAQSLRRLHDWGGTHSGLSAENILALPGDEGCALLGLAHVRNGRPPGAAARQRDLARLCAGVVDHVTPGECLRFLKAYLGSEFRAQWKSYWRSIAPRQANIARRRFLRAASITLPLISLLGCQATAQIGAVPSRHSVRSDTLLVQSNFELPPDHPLIQELVALRKEVSETLQLEVQQQREVVVYLFDTEQQYRDYIFSRYPNLPMRRAYFVGTKRELSVFTFWGERIEEDLRHEYTHGLLHAALGDVPLWLDEGLAEYFEIPKTAPGNVHAEHAQQLAKALAEGWKPDLPKLEQLDDFEKMQRLHYGESWAWVHFMLHNSPETRDTLLTYLSDLKNGHARPALHRRLDDSIPQVEQRFASHLATLPATGVLVGAR